MDGLKPIRAAGGAVWRLAEDGAEVLVVHRPRFDDWSLPKGKVKRGEHLATAAVREVLEETGVRAELGPKLPTVRYEVPLNGSLTEKVVDFWAMRVVDDLGFTPGDEVDGRQWLQIRRASRRLTYARDRTVLRALAALDPPVPTPTILVRHAQAGRRRPVADSDRPLTTTGLAQARHLSRLLPLFGPTRIVSATPVRCRQTMAALAQRLDIPVELDVAFDEDGDPDEAAQRLRSFAANGTTVVCSQGGLIGPALASLAGRSPERFHPRKGEGWVLTVGDAGVTAIDPLA